MEQAVGQDRFERGYRERGQFERARALETQPKVEGGVDVVNRTVSISPEPPVAGPFSKEWLKPRLDSPQQRIEVGNRHDQRSSGPQPRGGEIEDGARVFQVFEYAGCDDETEHVPRRRKKLADVDVHELELPACDELFLARARAAAIILGDRSMPTTSKPSSAMAPVTMPVPHPESIALRFGTSPERRMRIRVSRVNNAILSRTDG